MQHEGFEWGLDGKREESNDTRQGKDSSDGARTELLPEGKGDTIQTAHPHVQSTVAHADLHASADYRRRAAETLAVRAIMDAHWEASTRHAH